MRPVQKDYSAVNDLFSACQATKARRRTNQASRGAAGGGDNANSGVGDSSVGDGGVGDGAGAGAGASAAADADAAAADVAAGPSRYCPPEPASTSSTAARRKMAVWCSAGISMNLPAAISSGESREFCHVTYSPMPGRACSESSM